MCLSRLGCADLLALVPCCHFALSAGVHCMLASEVWHRPPTLSLSFNPPPSCRRRPCVCACFVEWLLSGQHRYRHGVDSYLGRRVEPVFRVRERCLVSVHAAMHACYDLEMHLAVTPAGLCHQPCLAPLASS